MLKEWLAREYATDPARVGAFAAASCKVVRVRRRVWLGHRVAADATVSIGDERVGSTATTKPRWKLLPEAIRVQFAAFEKAVDGVVAAHCATARADDDGRPPLLLGGGTYVVETAQWPAVERALRSAQEAWGAAADRWTTEDGYAELHELLKAQLGDKDYDRAKDLVPKRDVLRRKFGLEVHTLPVRLTPTSGDTPAERDGLKAAVLELLESGVREPREAAAATWDGLAGSLIDASGQAVRRTRQHKPAAADSAEATPLPGTIAISRNLGARNLLPSRAGADRLHGRPCTDPVLAAHVEKIRSELPDGRTEAAVVAGNLNADDTAAVRLGRILLAAAAAARDEAGMCRILAARGRLTPPTPSP